MLPQQYCLRWRYHHSNLQTMFSQLLEREAFCDVTLACEGRTIKAHKIVLSACSTYFETILSQYEEKDPILIMKDVKYVDIKCLVEFMYKGEINVDHCHLATLLKTAEELKIKGLAEVSWRDEDNQPSSQSSASADTHNNGSSHTNITQNGVANNSSSLNSDNIATNSNRSSPTNSIQRSLSQTTTNAVESKATSKVEGHGKSQPHGSQINSNNSYNNSNHNNNNNGTYNNNHSYNYKRKRGRPPIDDYDQKSAFSHPKLPHIQTHTTDESYSNDALSNSDQDLSIWEEGSPKNDLNDRLDQDEVLQQAIRIKREHTDEDPYTDDNMCQYSPNDINSFKFDNLSRSMKSMTNLSTSGGQSFLTPSLEKEWPDVVKMNDYLNTGRRQQFWEEPFTKRVMDAIKTKNLEMKVAAELLGVSYGTLYGRYRDSYGCLKHPYRTSTKVERIVCENEVSVCCHQRSNEWTSVDVPKLKNPFSDDNIEWQCGTGPTLFSSGSNEKSFNVLRGELPWMMGIYKSYSGSPYTFKCGGTLIHPRAVLTSTHCIVSSKPSELIVLPTGLTILPHPNSQSIKSRVVKIIRHPEYYSGGLYNDLAIIIMDSPIQSATIPVNPICLPDDVEDNFVTGLVQCWASGWTKDLTDEGRLLNKIPVPILQRDYCEKRLRTSRFDEHFQLHESFMCADANGKTDTCYGDGGEPLICQINNRIEIVGVTSWGTTCRYLERLRVYTDIRRFVDWISLELKKNHLI